MKAKIIALLLALFVITIPAHADINPQKPPQVIKKIDINHANVSTLTGSFKGIGKKRAQAIIDYRESHQGFKSIEELAEVKGFGQRFIDKNRDALKEVFVVSKK